MNRRAARWLAPICLFLAFVFGGPVGGVHAESAHSTAAAVPATVATTAGTNPEPPPITANEFLPEDRDLSDCVGVLEKPGCGSEERGGPMLNLVFLLVMAGMSFIFWRVIVGVRKNRAELERTESNKP